MGRSAIVVGAGIAGLAMARALGSRGYRVKVFERNGKAVGASVRNFGMIWPVGQPDGGLYEMALESRAIWAELCEESKIWNEQKGSLHVAHADDEWTVLNELGQVYRNRGLKLMTPQQVGKLAPNVVIEGLRGGLFSPTEMIVDPRVMIERIPMYLAEKFGVEFHFSEPVLRIDHPSVQTSVGQYSADEIFVCSGADFETLYPGHYSIQPLTRCKLQMMRMEAQPSRIGPALCGALSLAHYQAFRAAPSLPALVDRFQTDYAELLKWGIHVMVSQNAIGELTIGDSHEYGNDPEPFDRSFINDLILGYLERFARFERSVITQTWNGIYPKLTNGKAMLILDPEPGVKIVNGFGGAGMTLAFGVCEGIVAGKT